MIPLRDDQPTRTFPFFTLLLIAVNAYVFLAWQIPTGVDESVDLAGFLPLEFTSHKPEGWIHLFTAMFMHGSLMHLIGNMWFLWIFGKNIEDNCGHIRYLIFYLVCGVAATLAFTALAPHSEIPLVGASGAISGVLGAYLIQHYNARIFTIVPLGPFIRLMDVPAWVFLLVWMALQIGSQIVESSARHGHSGGVAYGAHIGGFVAGAVLVIFFEKKEGYRR